MLHSPKNRFYLHLLVLLPSALAKTKTFKFTDDFYLKFQPLETAIGPDNAGALLSALNAYAEQFKNVWIKQIESELLGGKCTVGGMALPEFSICDWKYPDKYDIDELPLAGQCYHYDVDTPASAFVQRAYYKIKDLEITCSEDFDFDDLDKDAYTNAAFAGTAFMDIFSDCGGNGSSSCLFATAETVESSGPDVCTAELFINRFIDIPIYLKCLTVGYGPKIANKMIKALDEFFEVYVMPVLADMISSDIPDGFVYNFVSPYASDRKYCGHGSYYANGYIVEQVPCNDGIIITKFMYGFDVIYYRPLEFGGELLADEDIPSIIDSIFDEKNFLSFLKNIYPDEDFTQELTVCTVIDPDECEATFPPITPQPSKSPSYPPVVPEIISTSSPTISSTTTNPTMFPTITNPPTKVYEPTASPTFTSSPSSAPTPIPSSQLPTFKPTGGNTDNEGSTGTQMPTLPAPDTPQPTCPNCIIHPDDLEPDKCPIVTTGTCGGGARGDGICPFAGYCCSKWGWCGTTAEYCEEDSNAPTPSIIDGAPQAPTYSIDAGQCAIGEVGDGYCPDESHCCSDYGYCGTGEMYCYTTACPDDEGQADEGSANQESEKGTCGGGGIGNGICNDGLCCSQYGFCGEGELYCTGLNDLQESDTVVDEAEKVINSSPLPEGLKPDFGFRCGITEVDARSNCKTKCTHHTQCAEGEECWGIQLNYCNAFEEGEHPLCTDLDIADNDSRCGFDEASARGYCGVKCSSDDECGDREFCFPTLLNLCECHETSPEAEENAIVFFRAKSLISPYFVESDPLNTVEGKPRNASNESHLSVVAIVLLGFTSMMF